MSEKQNSGEIMYNEEGQIITQMKNLQNENL